MRARQKILDKGAAGVDDNGFSGSPQNHAAGGDVYFI
jgi:hypothetical protein